MGPMRDPERDEYDNLYLRGTMGLPIYLLADPSEQTAFCQRMWVLADNFGKKLYILDYGKAHLNAIRGEPPMVQELRTSAVTAHLLTNGGGIRLFLPVEIGVDGPRGGPATVQVRPVPANPTGLTR